MKRQYDDFDPGRGRTPGRTRGRGYGSGGRGECCQDVCSSVAITMVVFRPWSYQSITSFTQAAVEIITITVEVATSITAAGVAMEAMIMEVRQRENYFAIAWFPRQSLIPFYL